MRSNYRYSNSKLALGLLCATAMTAIAPSAMAQTGADSSGQIETVTITATKLGETDPQKTALSVTAITAADLAQSNIIGSQGLAQYTPNVQVAQNNQYAEFYIRGIGSNNVFNGSDPDVTTNIDGIYIGRPFGQFTSFLDVARVEVLRGPQGTLYGRNSVGGTINVVSRRPTEDLESEVRVGTGKYDEAQADAYVSDAIIPGLAAFSLSGSYYRHDPYIKDIVAGGPDVNGANQGTVRGQLLLTPFDGFEATTRADFATTQAPGLGTVNLLLPYDAVTNTILGDYHKVALKGTVGTFTVNSGVAEDMTYTFNDALHLRSLTAFRFNNLVSNGETDGTDLGFQDTKLEEKDHAFSQELTASGKASIFEYVGGLYYYGESDKSANDVQSSKTNVATITQPYVYDNSYAIYGNVNVHVTDSLTLILGDRYTAEKKSVIQFGGAFSIITGLNGDLPGAGYIKGGPSSYQLANKYSASTPKAAIQYQVTDDIMAYFSATRGFKSGGFNQSLLPVNATTPIVGFAPETLWSYEGGVKTQWFDNRLRLNLTGFHYDYSNLQVQAFIVPGTTSITNAASASINGFELQAEGKPIPELDLGANISTLDATYSSYPAAPTTGTNTINASGNTLNEAPPFSANGWAQYDYALEGGGSVFFRTEYAWQARVYFTVANDTIQTQKAYGLANFMAGWNLADDKWTVMVWTKNAFDQQYITQTSTAAATTAGHAGDPLTYGVTLAWHL